MSWTSTPSPGGWIFTDDATKAQISLDYLHPTARGLEAWVELRVPEQEIPVSEGNQDLMRVGAIRRFLEDAKRRAQGPAWEDGLRQAFHETIEAHRDSALTIDLMEVEPSDVQFLLDPLVDSSGMTRLIAKGGSGKSLFSMAICLSVATGRQFLGLQPAVTGPVLYLDYEADKSTHRRRIDALCEPLGVPPPDRELLMYRFESVPLFRSAQTIRRICDKYGIVFVVVDSAKMAAGPSGGYGGSEDSALNLYLGLREIGRPGMMIDHKTKEDIEKGRRGGYGSVFYENLARMQWEMMKLQDMSPTERQFTLELTKENNVGRLPPLGFKLLTAGNGSGTLESAQFTQMDPSQIADPTVDDMPDRIAALLGGSSEPLTVQRIADMLYGKDEGRSKKASIRTRLNQDSRFENVSQGKTGAWILTGDPGDAGTQTNIGETEAAKEWEGEIF